MIRVLFIYKKRSSYGDENGYPLDSFGLSKSAKLIVDALNNLRSPQIVAKSVGVVDNNSIDSEVHNYKPTHVIIEALWVVPPKFNVLIDLHPLVQWNIRVHSKVPFLANEGIAIHWLREYLTIGDMDSNKLSISGNNLEFVREFKNLYPGDRKKIHYLPNIYEFLPSLKPISHNEPVLKVGCFSSIRPMKNQLQQAIASILLAEEFDTRLEFHMNSRTEQSGEQVLKNIKALFLGTEHKLILHPWLDHADFIQLVRTMDIGLQVSMTESFNIVSADFCSQNIPIVVSPDIEWVNDLYKADPNSAIDIKNKMKRALFLRNFGVQHLNLRNLKKFSMQSLIHWLKFLNYGG